MRSYEAARGLFSFLGICSWAIIIVGGIIAFGGATAASTFARNVGALQALLAAAPGIILSMVGLYGLALVQMGRAGVDSAEYAQQSLQVSRDQLEVSRQALQQGNQLVASYGELAAKKSTGEPVSTSDAAETSAAGPSYGKRQEQPRPSELAEQEAPTSPALEHKPEIPFEASATKESAATNPGEIVKRDATYHVGKQTFETAEAAKRYADQLGVNPKAKLRST